jgi:ribosomal protein S18 acetylase RimI-like enzyme
VSLRIQSDHAVTDADAVDLWPLYDEVFGESSTFEDWREGVWRVHAARDGFRLVRAYLDGSLVGFAYGYTGEPGQWWTDEAAKVLVPEVAADWLGGHFELVSIGVLPAARQLGIGRELLRQITDGLPHDRMLLMTSSDAVDPARGLYASAGWVVIGPGIGKGTVIMGRRAPQSSVCDR